MAARTAVRDMRHQIMVVLLVCIAYKKSAAALSASPPPPAAIGSLPSVLPVYEGLIRVQNGRFVDSNCQEFPVTGMNTWLLMETAAGTATQPFEVPGVDAIQFTFNDAAANGFTVVRSFAHGVNSSLVLQTSPGVYNETAFKALDYILDVAAYNGVKVLWTMGDNWQYADSKRNYNIWAGLDEESDDFWTSPVTRQMYKDHMRAMVNRVNTYNGIMYKDDPTIFAWNVMNEPRCNCFPTQLPYPADFNILPAGCNPSCADNITAWIGEMSMALKSYDPNHLVTVGEEGFWGYYDQNMIYNPENSVSPWAALTGNNFTADHTFASIDFCGVHYWPDQWTPGANDSAFLPTWMDMHATTCQAMGKPLVLEEFGKNVTVGLGQAVLESSITDRRGPLMTLIYSNYNQSFAGDAPWRGTLFWKWGLSPYNDDDDFLEVASHDSDFLGIIVPAALSVLMKSISNSPLLMCELVPLLNSTAISPSSYTGITAEGPSGLVLPIEVQRQNVVTQTIYSPAPPAPQATVIPSSVPPPPPVSAVEQTAAPASQSNSSGISSGSTIAQLQTAGRR